MTTGQSRETRVAGGACTHIDVSYRGFVVHVLFTSSHWRVWWPSNASWSTVYQVIQDEVPSGTTAIIRPRNNGRVMRVSVDRLTEVAQDGLRVSVPLRGSGAVAWADETEDRWISDARQPYSVSVVGYGTEVRSVQQLLEQLRPRGITRTTAQTIGELVEQQICRLHDAASCDDDV